MMKPDFFLVGAPKCGTTALSTYLSEHPQAFVSSPKEPHYFATDLAGYREVRTRRQYEGLFEAPGPDCRCRGEASVFYLYSRDAARRVHEYAPHAKILILVRNPLDLVTSLHAQLLYSRDEDERDFVRAWRLTRQRKAGSRIPRLCRDHKVLWYDEIARLGEQSERWLHAFGEQQVKFVGFDQFVSDTPRVYRNVLEFLQLPDDGRTNFPQINARKGQRIGWLADFTERTPGPLVRAAMAAKRMLGIRQWGVLDRLRHWNSTRIALRTVVDPQTRQEILDNYEDDVLLLAHHMGERLDHWLDGTVASHDPTTTDETNTAADEHLCLSASPPSR